MKETFISDLKKKGFNRWTKGALDRLYINATELGLVVERYKTGNISYAEFRGERIGNSRGAKMIGTKTFIDINTGCIHSGDAMLAHAAADLTGLPYEANDWDTIINLKEV